MTDDLASLFAYNRSADAKVLDVCRLLTPDQYTSEVVPGWPSVRSTVVHIAGATGAWARRFAGESVTSLTTEDELPTVDDVARVLAHAHDAIDRVVAGSSPEQLAAPFTYKNIRGQVVRAPLWAALRHVVNHATYHRGQIASKLGRLGVEAPVTDLVYWAVEEAERG